MTVQGSEGWWTGHPVGRADIVGMFPAEYVEAAGAAADAAGTAGEASGASDGAAPAVSEATAPAATESATEAAPAGGSDDPPAAAPVGVRATVLYDYASTDEGFLGLTAGDVVIVTEQPEGGWWTGHRDGDPASAGLFPSEYVELSSDSPGVDAGAAGVATQDAAGSGSDDVAAGASSSSGGGRFKVLY